MVLALCAKHHVILMGAQHTQRLKGRASDVLFASLASLEKNSPSL